MELQKNTLFQLKEFINSFVVRLLNKGVEEKGRGSYKEETEVDTI